jgi:hypothetical protein
MVATSKASVLPCNLPADPVTRRLSVDPRTVPMLRDPVERSFGCRSPDFLQKQVGRLVSHVNCPKASLAGLLFGLLSSLFRARSLLEIIPARAALSLVPLAGEKGLHLEGNSEAELSMLGTSKHDCSKAWSRAQTITCCCHPVHCFG